MTDERRGGERLDEAGVAMEAGIIPFGDAVGAKDLVRQIGQGTPLGRVLPGLVAEMAADAELAHSYRDLVIEPNRTRWRAAVQRGIERGELASDTDVELVLNALAGLDLILARYGTAAAAALPC